MIEKKVTLGNIIQIGLIIFSAAAGYYGLGSRIDKLGGHIAVLETRVNYIENDPQRRLESIEGKLDQLISSQANK